MAASMGASIGAFSLGPYFMLPMKGPDPDSRRFPPALILDSHQGRPGGDFAHWALGIPILAGSNRTTALCVPMQT
jgi:hypothetical protein